MGELVGLCVELRVAQALVADQHRQGIGRACRLLFETLVGQQRAVELRRRWA
ncbi:hypothetical protein D3C84_1129260 [compost metagenome]